MTEKVKVIAESDDDLKDEIYATIRRLERLAQRLETYAEEHDAPEEAD